MCLCVPSITDSRLAQGFSTSQCAKIAMPEFGMSIRTERFVMKFIINGQKHEYLVTSEHAKIVDGRTYLKLCRRSTVVRRMLAVQVDVDCSRNDPMWVLARSNAIDVIAELRFRKMKDHVLNCIQGRRDFWNQSETPGRVAPSAVQKGRRCAIQALAEYKVPARHRYTA